MFYPSSYTLVFCSNRYKPCVYGLTAQALHLADTQLGLNDTKLSVLAVCKLGDPYRDVGIFIVEPIRPAL